MNLNVMWLGFVLILFVHMHGIIWRFGEGVGVKLGVQGQGDGRISDVDRQRHGGGGGGGGGGEFENWTHGCHYNVLSPIP